MAGSVIISSNRTWSVGGIAFETISRLTRAALTSNGGAKDVYESIDDGFDFLSLDSLGKEDFGEFASACRRQFDLCKTTGQCDDLPTEFYDGVMSCWAEFLDLLEEDSRYSS